MPKVYRYQVVLEGTIAQQIDEDTGELETKAQLTKIVEDSIKLDLLSGVSQPVMTVRIVRPGRKGGSDA